jgi:formylglycine-generating enzyme required for sulfatase activity
MFKECSNCPQMIVVKSGAFAMGSPPSEPWRFDDEGPQHRVVVRRLAVGQFEVTFNDWDACVADGGCNGYKPSDAGWGRGTRPVINVNWNDANAYVTWLAQKTGKPYRLLSEAEYEYATRAETTTAYPWGDAIGTNNANCSRCGSQWDGKMTAPVGSFAVNNLALYDMVGNVWEWTQDCWRDNYTGAPTDGSAWTSGNCNSHIARGGSWNDTPVQLRSAVRNSFSTVIRIVTVGFRVARTLEQ